MAGGRKAQGLPPGRSGWNRRRSQGFHGAEPRGKQGKRFEAQFGHSLGRIPGAVAYWNSNSRKPVCDWRATFYGAAVVIECKETRDTRFYFADLSEREREHLQANHDAGGLSAVAIRHLSPDGHAAMYMVSWLNWMALEKAQGAIGLKGFALVGERRPPQLQEVPWVQIGRSWGYDLGPWLARCALAWHTWNAAELRKIIPDSV